MAEEEEGGNRPGRWAGTLRSVLDEAPGEEALRALSTQKRNRLRRELVEISGRITELANAADPVREPSSVFDPYHPDNVGMLVAMALLIQDRVPLPEVERQYGSGVYAVYYRGGFDAYAPLAGKEHPIYVGKVDPAVQNAREAREQGEKLTTRLREHAKSIRRAGNLAPEEFDCRYMVVASGMQEAVEKHLIRLFQPVWNNEVGICHGIGKHGDNSRTRGNKRSPWDTLHAGRPWAGEDDIPDQVPETEIRENLRRHFDAHPPFETVEEALDALLLPVKQ